MLAVKSQQLSDTTYSGRSLLVSRQSLSDCRNNYRHGEPFWRDVALAGFHCHNLDPAHDSDDADFGGDLQLVRYLHVFIVHKYRKTNLNIS